MNTSTTRRWLAVATPVLIAMVLAGTLFTGTVQAQGAMPWGSWDMYGGMGSHMMGSPMMGSPMMGGHMMGSPMMGGHMMGGHMMGYGLGTTTTTTATTGYGYPHHGWGMMGATTAMTGTTSTYACPGHAAMGWHN
jgi:hypothetical protein